MFGGTWYGRLFGSAFLEDTIREKQNSNWARDAMIRKGGLLFYFLLDLVLMVVQVRVLCLIWTLDMSSISHTHVRYRLSSCRRDTAWLYSWLTAEPGALLMQCWWD